MPDCIFLAAGERYLSKQGVCCSSMPKWRTGGGGGGVIIEDDEATPKAYNLNPASLGSTRLGPEVLLGKCFLEIVL